MNNSAIGKSWMEVRTELFTPEEIRAMELRVKTMHNLLAARRKKRLTQRESEKNAECPVIMPALPVNKNIYVNTETKTATDTGTGILTA